MTRRDHAARRRRSADLRVVDLSTVLAGPNCARYLADFGADVIKVERPDGDSLRRMAWRDRARRRGPVVEARQPQQAHDRPRPQGRRPTATCCSRLVDDAHVLVENFRPGTLERLGLGPDVLLARNPRLVITRVTGFGQDGPYAAAAGLRHHRRGDVGVRGAERRARRPAAAAADRPHRRGDRTRRRVRHDGRAPLRRRPGRRRQPARVDAPDDGPARRAVRADRRAAAAARRGPAVHRAARHVPVRATASGSAVSTSSDSVAAARARAARRRRRRAVRRRSPGGRSTATSSRR